MASSKRCHVMASSFCIKLDDANYHWVEEIIDELPSNVPPRRTTTTALDIGLVVEAGGPKSDT